MLFPCPNLKPVWWKLSIGTGRVDAPSFDPKRNKTPRIVLITKLFTATIASRAVKQNVKTTLKTPTTKPSHIPDQEPR